MKKIVSKSLCWVLVCAMILAQLLIPMPLQAEAASAVRAADTDIQNGVTLHCWNWSYAAIIENLPRIAAQGYTAIQVSPVQKAKQPTMGAPGTDWWVAYQPADFAIDNTGVNFMGTKAEFMNMCETAHEYGIYVIVDVVANHMAQLYGTTRSPEIIADILNDNSCWHNRNQSIGYDYSSRERITQYDLDSVLDLNTGSKKVQNHVLNYLKELIDAGADGFRFDAVKHIETPDDNKSFASDFWPTVIYGAEDYAESKGLDLYCYGELLDHPDESGTLPDSAYTKYFSITDNSWGNTVRSNVVAGGNASAFSSGYHKNAEANQLVLWAESHDTYTNKSSSGVSVENINKTWALVASRADAMSLYLARMEGFTPPYGLGVAYDIGWHEASVAAVNKFHKAFVGQSEYLASSGSIAYVERGTSGVVLVNVGGNGTSVNVPANKIANGTYKDQITGNTFTVSGGRIKGNIGATGIAVVYNVAACSHSSHYIAGLCATCGATVSHSYSGNTCSCGKTKPVTGTCAHAEHRYNGVCRGCGSNVGHSNANGICSVCGVEQPVDTFAYYLAGYINNANVNDADENYRFKDGKLTFYSSTDAYVAVRTLGGLFYQTTPDSQYKDTVLLHNASMGGSNNSQMRIPGGKTVTLYLQSNYNGTYTLSYAEGGIVNPQPNPGPTTIYFKNTAGWSTPYIYAWSDSRATTTSAWPGNAMTKVAGETDVYSYTLNGYASKVIFHDNNGTQTLDLVIPTDGKNMYTYSSNGWSNYTAIGGGSTTTTQTVYVDITGFNWSKVNVYAWDDNEVKYTGEWPGSAMTKVSGNIYSFEVPTGATKIIFNDGTNQTNDLTIPTDGKNLYNYMQNSWSAYATECSHSYSSKVTLAASCTQNGLRTYTCSLCGVSYTEGIPATGHSWSADRCTVCDTVCNHNWIDGICRTCGSACGHKWSNGTCRVCNLVCFHRNWVDGACVDCSLTCSHSYENGRCIVCGLRDPNNTTPSTIYYLIGYINGANYGCEDDSANMGEYKFVNGKVTAKFDTDSYVAVKKADNAGWYMTDGWLGTDVTSATLYDTSITGENSNKLFVPGGVEVTFTLVENTDGSLTLSYSTGGQVTPTPNPTTTTIYFDNSGSNWSKVHVHAWNADGDLTGGWPGAAMTKVSGNIYSFEVPTTATGIIFNNGNGGVGNQTDDLIIPTDGKNQFSSATNAWSVYSTGTGTECNHSFADGFCTVCGMADPDYIPSVNYYLVGSMNDWTASEEYKLVKSNGVYTLSVNLAAGEYTFKVKDSNDNWYPDGMGNDLYVKVDFAGNVTFTFNPATGETTAEAGIVRNDSPDIKWQVTRGTNANSATTNLRFLTWVDSLENYSAVTFNVTINGKTTKLECTTVYTAILASGVAIRNPANIFGQEDAKYFATYTLANIPNSAFNTPIIVTVTWTDLQGNQTTSDYETIIIADDWA